MIDAGGERGPGEQGRDTRVTKSVVLILPGIGSSGLRLRPDHRLTTTEDEEVHHG